VDGLDVVGAQHRVEGRVVGQAVQWELGAFQRAAVAAILHPHQSLTARDLQLGRRIKRERLQASSGAISGAVKWLTSVGLVERVPAPASHRDHYRLRDNAWAIQYTNQNEVTSAVLKAAEAGIAATEDGSPARQRLTQMRDFYNFLFEEIPALLDRWYQQSGSTET
jgi:DNA-binding transcriptional regulator GbsR (MarR family)